MIKVIVSSSNKSKINSVEIAFNKLNMGEFEVISMPMKSEVSSQPINEDVLLGARNRNSKLKKYCESNNIDYDILISIEGGFENVDDEYFLVTYAAVYKASVEKEVIGKSAGLPITKKMFDYLKAGNDLNTLIENITEFKNNHKENGVSGFLTNGYYYRSYFDSKAIVSAFQKFINKKFYDMIDEQI